MNASALLSRHRAVAGSTRSDAGGRECDLSGPCKEPPLPAASLRVDSSMSPHVPAPYAPPLRYCRWNQETSKLERQTSSPRRNRVNYFCEYCFFSWDAQIVAIHPRRRRCKENQTSYDEFLTIAIVLMDRNGICLLFIVL